MTNKTKFIGLTGGIGMGKTTVAAMLREKGFPVWSADDAVHEMYKKGGVAVGPVSALFPETLREDGAIDRVLLGKIISGDDAKTKALNAIVHPLVEKAEAAFRKKVEEEGVAFAFLEIPLLFETKAEKRCDLVLCVSAPSREQKKRVMQRPDMSVEKFNHFYACQMSDEERCRRAHFVLSTGGSLDKTRADLDAILIKMGAHTSKAHPESPLRRLHVFAISALWFL